MPQYSNTCKCKQYSWSLQNQLPNNSKFSVQWMDCNGKLHQLKDTQLTGGTITCSSIKPRFILNRTQYRNVIVLEGDCCCDCYEFSTSSTNPCFARIKDCQTNKFNLISVNNLGTICSSIVPISNCAFQTKISNCIFDSNTNLFGCNITTTTTSTLTTTTTTSILTTTTTIMCHTIASVNISSESLNSSEDNTVYMFYENCLGSAITLSFTQSGDTFLDGTDCVIQNNQYFPEISFWIFSGSGMTEVTSENDFSLGQSCVVTTGTTKPCYEFLVNISQTDIDSAVNNNYQYFNGKVFITYTGCSTGQFILKSYTASTNETICVYGPIISMYYLSNNQYNYASQSSKSQVGTCFISTTTTTFYITTTTTTV